MTYPLKLEGGVLVARSTSLSDEYCQQHFDLSLRQETTFDVDGRPRKRFRLMARHPHNRTAAMAYRILCPTCKTVPLTVLGPCLDAHKLCLYGCECCDKF